METFENQMPTLANVPGPGCWLPAVGFFFFLGQEKVAYCQSGTIALLSHKPMTGPQESTPESRFESFDQVILFQIEIMYGYL